MRMALSVEKLLPFDRLDINEFVLPKAKTFVGIGWNFIKLLLDIYDNGVIIHITLVQDV